MTEIQLESGQDLLPRQRADLSVILEAAKPYITTMLLVALLLSIWISLNSV